MRIYQNTIFDNTVDEAKQETSAAIQLLLVKTSLEIVISEGNSHKVMNVLLIFPQY